MPFADFALAYDADSRSCDLVLAADGLVLDRTPLTALLVSLGTDRLARADDELPQPEEAGEAPAQLNPRRGWWGDALDSRGQIGSRLWLLERRKQAEQTRRDAQTYCAEALDWIESRRATPVTLRVSWLRRGVLGITARAGSDSIDVQQPVLA
ncbi:phage GP46 family protein [Pseudoroseomonas cervicalis]|uniref:phage GP46 family protein n=1 Tax=Teichococcus cervicalis TaxID=204525 RepID=UPI0035EABC0A